MAIIIQELKNEELAKAGEYERIFYDFDQLLPDEEEREVLAKQEEEEINRIGKYQTNMCQNWNRKANNIFYYRTGAIS